MSEILFFFILYLLFLLSIVCAIIVPYCSSYIAWFKYAKDAKEVFGKQNQLKDFPMIIKNYKYKSLIIFTILNILYITTSFTFLWVWISANNNIYYIIPFMFTFIISYILFIY